jgi:hypothetical protein
MKYINQLRDSPEHVLIFHHKEHNLDVGRCRKEGDKTGTGLLVTNLVRIWSL